jgi:pimeloyl-ACP methyl ester carboxylesterase
MRRTAPALLLCGLAAGCLGNVQIRKVRSFAAIDYGLPEKFATVGGIRLCYVDEGKGDEVLVFLPPAMSNLTVWRDTILALRSRYRVIAIDLPGHGKSDKPPRFRYHPDTFAKVVARLLDHLGVAQATLVGNSNGGASALAFALRYPRRTRRLVLVSPAGARAAPPWQRRLLRWAATPTNLGTLNPYLFKWGLERATFRRTGPRTDRFIADQLAIRGAGEEFRAFLRAQVKLLRAAAAYDVSARGKEIKAPTLIVWGEGDRLLPRELGEKLARAIPGAQLVVLPAVGHMPELEVPEAFNQILGEFLHRTAALLPAPRARPAKKKEKEEKEEKEEEKEEKE